MGLPKSIDYKHCVYGLTGPDGAIKYIGHARYAAERLALHKHRARKGSHDHLPVYQWMHAIGLENVTVTILEKFDEEVNLDTVIEREKYWISTYRSVSEITNLSDGGYECHLPSMRRGEDHPRFGVTLTEEHKAAIVASNKKRFEEMTPEQHKAMVEKHKAIGKARWDNMTPEEHEEFSTKLRKAQSMWLTTLTPEEMHFTKSRGAHVLHHVNNKKPNPECVHCQNENLV